MPCIGPAAMSLRTPLSCCLISTLALACSQSLLQGASGKLEVDTASLDFGISYLGYPTTRTLTLRNLGPAALECQFEPPAPFAAPSPTFTVPGAGDAGLTMTFDPKQVGEARAKVALRCDSEEIEIELSGIAAEPAKCDPSSECLEIRFDPASGTCLRHDKPDGLACPLANQCLVDGTCRAGECVGTSRDCDDRNACTRDACDPTAGCLHLDISADCPAPAEPCRVAACDPKSGCGTAWADDGTPCGAVDCKTADVCLLGSCQTVPVPEGALCAPATPCTGEGHCRNQVCDVPAPQPLQPLWSYRATPPPPPPWGGMSNSTASLSFTGAVDDRGHLYFIETNDLGFLDCCMDRAPIGCFTEELVSLTRDGFLRYRSVLPATGCDIGTASPDRIALDTPSDRLFVTSPGGMVTAFRMSDGGLLWTRNLLTSTTRVASCASTETLPSTVLPSGDVAATLRFNSTCSAPSNGYVLVLKGADGSLAWEIDSGDWIDSPIAGQDGSLYLATLPWLGGAGSRFVPVGPRIASYGPGGSQRWISPDTGQPLALSNGSLVAAYPTRALDAVSGATITSFALPLTPARAPLLTRSALIDWDDVAGMPFGGTHVRAQRTSDGGLQWTLQLLGAPYPNDEALLTSRSTALLLTRAMLSRGPQPLLHEVALAGKELYRCDLPGEPGPRFAVRSERLYLEIDGAIQVFAAPGLDFGGSGWGAAGGNLLRNRRGR